MVPSGGRSIEDLHQVSRPDPIARSGQVVVRVRAAALNRRDEAIATGTYFGRTVSRELVPLSDGAGEVIAVGDRVTRFKPGDRVVATFFQADPGGPQSGPREAMGSPLDGMLIEKIALYEDGLIPIPDGQSFEEASCLPCAGVTAWNALMVAGRPTRAGDTVLVLGTGGVAVFALQFAVAAGARVITTSSSDSKLERVRLLGASAGVNYRRTPDWAREVLKLTDGRGVDCVVELGGVGTLEQSFEALAPGGKVCLIGVMTGRRADINPYALMWKTGTLHGVRVGTKETFEEMTRAIEINQIRPVIERTFRFDQAIDAFQCLASGDFIGKIVISGQ